ncbi:MAG: ribosome-associated heat shock protein Hsp15 [Halieaceae bacterium]|jgi:ribosome-associated heat shock protein Hsp15
MNKLRLDKWLWAARFYKTRSLAKQAIEGGKVRFERGRVKVSKEIQLGDLLTVRQGLDEKTIEVLQLSDRRRGAPEAQMLYRETEPSIKLREESAAQRKLESSNRVWPEQRPTKKQRRQIHRFKQDTE